MGSVNNKVKQFIDENLKNNIVDFILTNSYFEYECDENGILHFSTRKNGSVLNETVSDLDIKEGKNIVSKLLKNYVDIDVKLEIVDEWVLIFVSNIEEKKDIFSYAFIKDKNGCGFTAQFDSMDELIKKYGDWIDVDWDFIRKEVENINIFNHNTFIGWHKSSRLLIKKAGENGNSWGYDFYIVKSKKDI